MLDRTLMARWPTSNEELPSASVLTARMVGVGLAFAAAPEPDADIEDTLVLASVIGMEHDDLRALSVLTTWLGVHHSCVNVARLDRMVAGRRSPRVRAYWSGIATWLRAHRRFSSLVAHCHEAPIDLLPVGTDLHIQRRGEDPRFAGSVLRVPRGTLRDREADVLAPALLAQRHAGYKNRMLMGPTFRADLWTVLERDRGLPLSECARQVGCSVATARRVARELRRGGEKS